MTAKLSPVIAMRCPRCGRSWNLPRRADGTYPQTAVCAKRRGGCGACVKVPKRARAAARAARAQAAAGSDGEPGAWNPPSGPRRPYPAVEPCPHCGEAKVYAEPRGTVRACLGCGKRVTPPGVLAPYQRGTEVTRAAKSQRERDDDAKKTVLIAGEFLRQVRAMLDDPQIHPASADLLGWYEEEITEARKARDGRRLAELADEFGADQEARAFRRRRWWQGQSAALTAGDAGEDEDEDEDAVTGYAAYAGDRGDQDGENPAGIAAQQKKRPMTWTDGIAACGWRLTPTIGGCQVIDEYGRHCAAETSSPAIPDGRGGDAWLCGRHYGTLAEVIPGHNRRVA